MATKKKRTSPARKSNAVRVPKARGVRGRQTRGDNTRATIIEAARRKFVSAPYDAVGLREIAAEAGIDKRLITRYFGSKEGLFGEVLDAARLDLRRAYQEPLDSARLGAFVTARIFAPGQMSARERMEMVSLCMQSATSSAARGIIHRSIESQLLPEWIGVTGKDRDLKAALMFATLIGIALTREVLEVGVLRKADAKQVERFLAPFIQSLVDS